MSRIFSLLRHAAACFKTPTNRPQNQVLRHAAACFNRWCLHTVWLVPTYCLVKECPLCGMCTGSIVWRWLGTYMVQDLHLMPPPCLPFYTDEAAMLNKWLLLNTIRVLGLDSVVSDLVNRTIQLPPNHGSCHIARARPHWQHLGYGVWHRFQCLRWKAVSSINQCIGVHVQHLSQGTPAMGQARQAAGVKESSWKTAHQGTLWTSTCEAGKI